MTQANSKRFTLSDLRVAAVGGKPEPMLTCYDFTTARLLESLGVRMILVGDSAANVILGHDSTIPIELDFLIQITAAVRKGAPNALVMADMPFGSCSVTASGIRACVRMVKQSGCDCVKVECGRGHIGLIQGLADSGVAAFAHLGLTPQSVGLLGGYRAQGRSSEQALRIADLAADLVNAGAAGLLLEAVPPEVTELVVKTLDVPVIGCGAGPAAHAHVVVLHDLLGFNASVPKFVPRPGNVPDAISKVVSRYVSDVRLGKYPNSSHCYQMPEAERKALKQEAADFGVEL